MNDQAAAELYVISRRQVRRPPFRRRHAVVLQRLPSSGRSGGLRVAERLARCIDDPR